MLENARADCGFARAWPLFHKEADQPVPQGGITQEEIAAEIGTVREIVARLLRDFAQAGWLERRRQRLVLKNRTALEEEARRW